MFLYYACRLDPLTCRLITSCFGLSYLLQPAIIARNSIRPVLPRRLIFGERTKEKGIAGESCIAGRFGMVSNLTFKLNSVGRTIRGLLGSG